MTPEEIAFTAGLFEGEGYVRRAGKNSVRLEIQMTDKEPLEKLFFLIEKSKLSGPFTYRAGTKPIWRWDLYGKPARDFLLQIYPWLCPRRQKQISNATEYRKQTKIVEGEEGPKT